PVLLLPGSRRSEIDYLLPPLLDAVRRLAQDGRLQFPLALAHTLPAEEIRRRVRDAGLDVRVIEGDTYDLIAAADLALVSSGTATLECALLERPMVIVYRLGPLSYGLGRLLVRGVRYIGMPHVVAVVCMLSHSGVETSVPFIAKYTFDQVFNQQHPEALPLVVVLVLGAAFLRGGLDFVGGYLTDWVGQRVVTDLRNELTAHVQR